MKRKRLIWIITALLFLLSVPAHASKNSKRLTYPLRDIWSTAVRLLTADLGYRIKDKDKDNGYILFVYPGHKGKEYGGNMQFIQFVDDQGNRMIRVQLDISSQPSYIMIQILDKLERKLLVEQGQPPEPEKVKKKKKESEKKADEGEKKGK